MAKCFKCNKELEGGFFEDDDPWDMAAHHALRFDGCRNGGSRLWEVDYDGEQPQVIICDDCLEAAKGTDKLRVVRVDCYLDHPRSEEENARLMASLDKSLVELHRKMREEVAEATADWIYKKGVMGVHFVTEPSLYVEVSYNEMVDNLASFPSKIILPDSSELPVRLEKVT